MTAAPDPGSWPDIPSYIPDWMLDTGSFALHASAAAAPPARDPLRDPARDPVPPVTGSLSVVESVADGAALSRGRHRAGNRFWPLLVGYGARGVHVAGPAVIAGGLSWALLRGAASPDRLWLGCAAGFLLGVALDQALERLAALRITSRMPRRGT